MAMSKENSHDLKFGQMVAQIVINALRPHCLKIEVAGSIRRERDHVHDVDIVLIPLPGTMPQIKEVALAFHPLFGNCPAPTWGDKKASFHYNGGIQVDLYFADEITWPILYLIRTGSKEHNISMCSTASRMGYKLKADGSGLYSDRDELTRIPCDTEIDIFRALGLVYKEPKEREVL